MSEALSFNDFAKIVLSQAAAPLTAQEVWLAGVADGLAERLATKGKTPEQTLMARLYVAAKKPGETGIEGVGNKPKRFRLVTDGVGPKTPPADVRAKSEETAKPVQPALPGLPENPVARKVKTTYSFKDCAQKVLEQFGKKRPMHYVEITRIALEKGWLISDGLRPEASMNAQIVTEIQRRQKRGEDSRFVKCGKGYYGLSQWHGKGLQFQIQEHNKEICKKLKKHLLEIPPKEFEALIGVLLLRMGYENPQVTSYGGDGGVDVRGTWVVTEGIRIKMAVQVKRWKNNVQRPVVQALRGSLATTERGLIITTSDFSPSAKEEADDPTKSSPISLINGDRLVGLFVEYGVKVRRTSVDILELEVDED